MEEKQRGGAREGAGRKKSEKETVTVSFRVDADNLAKAKEKHGRQLNKKINDYIKRIAKQK